MKHTILCCDWGTSSFRLRLVNSIDLTIIDEVKSLNGIAQVFKDWEKQSENKGQLRYDFYLARLKEQIQVLAERVSMNLDAIPIVLSGMASSSIGIENIPYASLPFSAKGDGVSFKAFDRTNSFPHQLILISGVQSTKDVMRGEEIQFLGIVNSKEFSLPKADQYVLVLPGTHSKHIYVKGGVMVDFETFMTGEIFNIISEYSILKDSISVNKLSVVSSAATKAAFRKGVEMSKTSILHSFFTVRTNQLFGIYSKEENFSYLSGLLIGSELFALKELDLPVVICSGENLFESYKLAAEELSFKDISFTSPELIDQATVIGQIRVYQYLIEQKLINE